MCSRRYDEEQSDPQTDHVIQDRKIFTLRCYSALNCESDDEKECAIFAKKKVKKVNIDV